jgi:GDP-D-mannose dehydratase
LPVLDKISVLNSFDQQAMTEMFGKVHALQQMEGTQFLPLATTACELYTDWGVIKSEVFEGLCRAPIL